MQRDTAVKTSFNVKDILWALQPVYSSIRLLIAAGADMKLADGQGITPLQHAWQHGQQAVAEHLEAAP